MIDECLFNKKKNASKEREKNKREKEKVGDREREREGAKERKKNIVEQEKNEKEKKIVSGRKYLADQVDYWYCCSISDHLNANLSRNTS
jgi:hypothetical protein